MSRPKVSPHPITATDMATFVSGDSDFAFEMRALVALRTSGFECSHSGSYRDPVTDKVRQFDIRALVHCEEGTLALAAECKNLQPNLPLLVSAVPRTVPEAFHDLIIHHRSAGLSYTQIRPIEGHRSAYKPGAMVGKKTDQVGIDASGNYVRNDEATFDKLNQAVNSCQDLISSLVLNGSPPFRRAVVPLLIVPSGTLWQVDYSADGVLLEAPRPVDHATLFLNHAWTVQSGAFGPHSCRLSHIEFVTLDALPNVTASFFGNTGFFVGAG